MSVGGIDEELVPGWDVLLELAEAHETPIGHPVWVLARVGASVAEYNALIDGVLSLRRFVNTSNGGLGYAVVETEA